MKYLKEATILGIGVIGGFVTCGVVVIKSAIKSDTFRKVMASAISAKIENLIYGEESPKRQKVSYRSYYDSFNNRQYSVKRSSGRYSWGMNHDNSFRLRDDILFDTREDADKVVDAMKEIVNQYGQVTVLDLYNFAGLSSMYTDTQYGWTDVSGIDVVSDIVGTRDVYILRLPKVSLLK